MRRMSITAAFVAVGGAGAMTAGVSSTTSATVPATPGTLEVVEYTETTPAPAADAGPLGDALLSADDLESAPELDYLGESWNDDDGIETESPGHDASAGGGLCPDGESFIVPASQASLYLRGGGGVFVRETIMSFDDPQSADSWVVAFGSCPHEWKEEGDPDEYITVEPIDSADLGRDTDGFVLRYEHTTSVDTEHLTGVAFVRVGPTLLIRLDVDIYDDAAHLSGPYDPTILNDLATAARAKVEATLD
jgi:hypothetical protein